MCLYLFCVDFQFMCSQNVCGDGFAIFHVRNFVECGHMPKCIVGKCLWPPFNSSSRICTPTKLGDNSRHTRYLIFCIFSKLFVIIFTNRCFFSGNKSNLQKVICRKSLFIIHTLEHRVPVKSGSQRGWIDGHYIFIDLINSNTKCVTNWLYRRVFMLGVNDSCQNFRFPVPTLCK